MIFIHFDGAVLIVGCGLHQKQDTVQCSLAPSTAHQQIMKTYSRHHTKHHAEKIWCLLHMRQRMSKRHLSNGDETGSNISAAVSYGGRLGLCCSAREMKQEDLSCRYAWKQVRYFAVTRKFLEKHASWQGSHFITVVFHVWYSNLSLMHFLSGATTHTGNRGRWFRLNCCQRYNKEGAFDQDRISSLQSSCLLGKD